MNYVIIREKFEVHGGYEMVGRIVGLVSCLLCAVPFLIISVYNKDSKEPINFWSGDTSLKNKVKNVQDYNKEMAIYDFRLCLHSATR